MILPVGCLASAITLTVLGLTAYYVHSIGAEFRYDLGILALAVIVVSAIALDMKKGN